MTLSRSIEDYPEGIILPIDKPYGWTSADVIRKIKFAAIHHFGKRNLKVGHAGTLDPLATGLLLVCIGPATRRAEELQRSDKEYLAGISFGATTASYDREKPIEARCPTDGVSAAALQAALPAFLGPQEQVAPLFSAKSVDGRRAYELARQAYKASLAKTTPDAASPVIPSETSLVIPSEAKESLPDAAALLSRQKITIYELELVGFEPEGGGTRSAAGEYRRIHSEDISGERLPHADLRVRCSKGTYIRALARDLGEALGSGAFLDDLRRTRNGGYTLADALTLDAALALLAP
ncbi:MAG: tRNA pseudouridine(55) synthase [Bacteroidales bacterium]|nr:tRNA pseudouridine(55) synthase [Bacteroidales bacterium]